MTTLDNMSNTYSMVLHLATFILNIQSNIKQMILYNMECRNFHPKLGVEIVDFKLYGCSSPW